MAQESLCLKGHGTNRTSPQGSTHPQALIYPKLQAISQNVFLDFLEFFNFFGFLEKISKRKTKHKIYTSMHTRVNQPHNNHHPSQEGQPTHKDHNHQFHTITTTLLPKPPSASKPKQYIAMQKEQGKHGVTKTPPS